jgi:hypothetical protein
MRKRKRRAGYQPGPIDPVFGVPMIELKKHKPSGNVVLRLNIGRKLHVNRDNFKKMSMTALVEVAMEELTKDIIKIAKPAMIGALEHHQRHLRRIDEEREYQEYLKERRLKERRERRANANRAKERKAAFKKAA